MKRVIITAASLLIALASIGKAKPKNSSPNFYKYVAKEIYEKSTFAKDGVSGTVKVRVTITGNGVQEVTLISGVSDKINQQIIDSIKNTPVEIASTVAGDEKTVIIIPVKLVISE